MELCYTLSVQQQPCGYKLVQLVSGAYSVHSLEHRETFHPVIGPVAEAEALYVNQLRLRKRMADHAGEFIIWDVGLGAAANVLTVLRSTRDLAVPVRILSFDQTLEPLRFAFGNAEALGYFESYENPVRRLLENGEVCFDNGAQKASWSVQVADFPALIRTSAAASLPKPHAILFDAYSPARNPAMWTLPLFENLYRLLDPARPCALPTYSRSTMLRVTLLLAGFCVGVGHPTGEKEETTIAANSPDLIAEPLDANWLRRAKNSTSAEPLHEAVYRQAPLTSHSWERLMDHPQFKAIADPTS